MKEAGLDVELKEYTFGQNIIKDITNKKIYLWNL